MRNPDDHRMAHRPPDASSGAPLHDLTENSIYPGDVYQHPEYYFTGDPLDWTAWGIISAARARPNKGIRIYRAVPRKKARTIRPGDWVTPVFGYARQHGRHSSDKTKDMDVLTAIVRASELHTAGDSMLEWGYNGRRRVRATVRFRARVPKRVKERVERVKKVRPLGKRTLSALTKRLAAADAEFAALPRGDGRWDALFDERWELATKLGLDPRTRQPKPMSNPLKRRCWGAMR